MSRILQAVVRFLREARRRKVFRTAALYVVGAWLALQVADVLFPGFGIPNAAIQALVWAAVLGFPVALVFGWLFEIGPGGIRRTGPLEAGARHEPQALRRSDYLILAAFVAVASVLVYRAAQDIRRTSHDGPVAKAQDDVGERLENSVAVLPFANISNDPDNEYFCDGVSEEILNELSEFRELNVIGRTSSFAFKGSDTGIDRISAVLGVRYVLQGSVRKAGDQLRISAQLLDDGGRQVWTESFDRQLSNVFAIQSEIADAVAAKVAAHVAPRPAAGHQPKLAAYDHYLAGRELLHQRVESEAAAELERAVDADPDFAEAHAELAIALSIGEPTAEHMDRARQSIDRALDLSPRLLRAQAARGLWLLQQAPPDPASAERILREVLAQDPNMSDALLWLSNALMGQGRVDESRPILERAARIDPLHPSIARNLSQRLLADGDVASAVRILERQLEQPEPGMGTFTDLRDVYRIAGRLVDLHTMARVQALDARNQSYYSLSLVYGLVGDWSAAEAWLERSLREYPEWPAAPLFEAMVPNWQGRTKDAARQLRQALEQRQISISSLDFYLRAFAGGILARGGDYDAAIEVLAPLVDVDAIDPKPDAAAPELFAAHALAWAYLRKGNDAEAKRLLEAVARDCAQRAAAGWLGSAFERHRCAENALLRGDVEAALTGLEQAIAAGWRDYYVREHDPYWAAVSDNPRYRKLMATVKADVDRQAAEIRRIDAREDFVAKLDAAMRERARAAP